MCQIHLTFGECVQQAEMRAFNDHFTGSSDMRCYFLNFVDIIKEFYFKEIENCVLRILK